MRLKMPLSKESQWDYLEAEMPAKTVSVPDEDKCLEQLRWFCWHHRGSVKLLTEKAGIARTYIYPILHGERKLNADKWPAVFKAMKEIMEDGND